MMNHAQIIEHVRKRSPDDKVMLSFSCGKDGWATWLAIRDHFEVHPFFYYLVPGLEFVDEYLGYAEKILGQRIVQLPGPMAYGLLSPEGLGMQTPERCQTLIDCNLQPFKHEDIQRAAAQCFGLPPTTYTALGVRAADSARRALFFKSHPPVTDTVYKFYPVWDWNKDRLMQELESAEIKLPIDYKYFGRTFDGIYLIFIKGLKDHFPRDYRRVLEFFPLAELELYRYEKKLAQ